MLGNADGARLCPTGASSIGLRYERYAVSAGLPFGLFGVAAVRAVTQRPAVGIPSSLPEAKLFRTETKALLPQSDSTQELTHYIH